MNCPENYDRFNPDLCKIVYIYCWECKGRDFIFFDQYKEWCKERDLPFEAYNVGCMTELMDYTPRTLEYILTNQEG